MRGSEIVAALPEAAGPARERAIFDALRADWVRLEWADITSRAGGHTAEITVSSDVLAVGDADDWVRVTLSHTTAQLAADYFGAILPTTRIADLISEQAAVRLSPCLQPADAAMASTPRMIRHHDEIEGKRRGRAGLVSTVGKDWVVTNRLRGHPDRSANYGWHDPHAPGGKLWQPLGLAHDRFHVDYSQTVRLVRRTMKVDGVERDIIDVLRDPELAGLVSDEGPISLWRLGAVAENATPSDGRTLRPPPTHAVPRTLRRGSRGPDVAEWQRVVEVGADGNFGPATERATKDWQRAHGLPADGVVGPRTRQAAGLEAGSGGDGAYPFVQARNFMKAERTSIDLIVLHSAEAAETAKTAENVAGWFAGANAPVASAHYCVDADSIVQCVLDKDVAYHAPGANQRGIGIELAGYAQQSAEDWADDYSETMLRRSAALTARLCAKYGVPIAFVDAAGLMANERGITTHRAVSAAFKKSTHADPGPSFPIEHYLDLVRQFH